MTRRSAENRVAGRDTPAHRANTIRKPRLGTDLQIGIQDADADAP